MKVPAMRTETSSAMLVKYSYYTLYMVRTVATGALDATFSVLVSS